MIDSPLTDSLLLVNPATADNPKLSHIHQSLIYIVDHSEAGTIGVNLNRFYSKPLSELVGPNSRLPTVDPERLTVPHVIFGGPLAGEEFWVLQSAAHTPAVGLSNRALALGFSPDAFAAVSEQDGRAIVGAGSFGWGPGQLERELADGLWLPFPSHYELLTAIPFHDPPLFAIHLFLQLRFGQRPPQPHAA
ncbi:hypothetical protein CAI21_21290 [Alkalilimnicola ehrlichii]|uniref:Uncharacterized protein n=1 Tax=Alkalilimnicola ehrlichii TaxID=351052 RepID=A0A3E0WJ46_9GAMM|nr:YqgE/AlgH family protein [Alkalilimnicola ehrlichii]RFA24527.1 hypothetical protein CAI21_21290 [Alkalilimnicola ehrlichii]RFA32171.1 hypothetical protein CAL65_20335 [Alkalilimnicola ehrlichii]